MSGAVGQSAARVGGVERVTGAQRYAADIRLDNVLQVKLVHLDCARARILSIDTREAAAVAGVRCILTAADLPQPMPRFGPTYADRPVLAVEETKFFGEPVAAVAAETEDAAEAAASLIRVQYEEARAVLTVEEALDPRSPLVQDPALRVNDSNAGTNILNQWRFGWGKVDGASADCVVENDYAFPMVTHFAIEPHVFLAAPDQNGVTIWSPIQHPYVLQRVVASALSMPVSKVRIIAPDPGGGFGGKGWPKFEPLVAFLALKTGRPVRLVLTLEESFQAARRASAQVHIRTGFDAGGRIAFQDIAADFLIGAYADVGPRVVSKASYAACGPYLTPHARIIARALLSHTTPSTAFRGFGTPQASWAVESQLDEAARRLGIDRVEIRRRNLPAKGQAFIPGDTPADGDWRQALEKAASAIALGPAAAQESRARNFAGSEELLHGFGVVCDSAPASRWQRLNHVRHVGHGTGRAHRLHAASRAGVGLCRSIASRSSWETRPSPHSIRRHPASRSTVFMGNAILKACQDIKAQLKQLACEMFDAPADAISVGGGSVRLPDRELTYPELLRLVYGSARGEVISVGSARSNYIADHPLGGKPAFWELMCVAAEVEVDVETGHGAGPQTGAGQRRREGAQSLAGRNAGRRRGRDGPGSHADGALDSRRARPHLESGRARLSHPDDSGYPAGHSFDTH